MKSVQTILNFSLAGVSLFAFGALAADECQPHTWQARLASPVTAQPPDPKVTPYARKAVQTEPGEINCRWWGRTYDEVNYYSCMNLAETFEITIEQFWLLNPQLAPDCEGIEPNTEYCVDGFIEPIRAVDGLCGPDHKNATCIGTDFGQCCNSETWKCGETEEDCASGICYEGLCPGHDVYTTDGKCGFDYGFRLCAGKWGDCCSLKGECGTGPDFCDADKCQSGNCTISQPSNQKA